MSRQNKGCCVPFSKCSRANGNIWMCFRTPSRVWVHWTIWALDAPMSIVIHFMPNLYQKSATKLSVISRLHQCHCGCVAYLLSEAVVVDTSALKEEERGRLCR